MQALGTVIGKVAVMLILIVTGWAVTKLKWFTERGAAECTTLLVKVVTPCLIVNSLITADSDLTPLQMLLAAGTAALAILLAVGVSLLFFRREPPDRQKVLRFAVIFSNAGFMGLPLVQGILGSRGVVFGSFFIVMFNLICWTYGYSMMGGGLNIRTALLNPGVIGLVVGLPIYFLKISLPAVITEPVAFLSGLNTPLAMLVIGSYVARVDARAFLSDRSVYQVCLLRLVVCPAVFLAVLLLLRPEPELFISSVIQASAPVAANTVLFAVEYHRDSELASKTVAVSTVLSILTIPVFTVLAQTACDLLF